MPGAIDRQRGGGRRCHMGQRCGAIYCGATVGERPPPDARDDAATLRRTAPTGGTVDRHGHNQGAARLAGIDPTRPPATCISPWAACRSEPSASSESRSTGGCSALPPFDSVSIPNDIEDREIATGIDQEAAPQVSGAVPPSAAGHEIGPGHPLKVKTRVRTPLGIRGQTYRSRAQSETKTATYSRLLARLIP